MSTQFDCVAVEVYKEQLELSRNTVFISTYRPPNTRIQIFSKELEMILDTLEKESKNDFNIDTLHLKHSIASEYFFNILSSNGY